MIELALVNKLRNNTPAGNRIYPMAVPEGVTQSCITYQRVNTRRYPIFGGNTDQETVKFQLDCWSNSYGEVKAIAQAVIGLLEGYSGDLTDGVTYSTQAGTLTTNEIDAYEPETKEYRVIIDVDITYKV